MRQTKFILNIASLGPIGHLPKAPGTWASLVACLLAPILFIPLSLFWKLVLLLLIFWSGALVAGQSEKIKGQVDPGWVVIDELLGQWTTFLFASKATPGLLVLGFILFRLLDIYKPCPIKQAETWLKGGYGIMLDDLVAGALACLFLTLILY